MAPKSSNKRTAQASKSTQPTKIQKKAEEKKIVEVHQDPLMEGLVNAMQHAELPDACKKMLLAMLPDSFTVPVEQRHEAQKRVVSMVGKVIEQLHCQMIKEVQEAMVALEAADGKKKAFETTVLEAESQEKAALETVRIKGVSVLDSAKLESEKQMLLDSAKDVQIKGDVEHEAVKKEKETFTNSVTSSFNMLHESDLEEKENLQHFEVVQPFIGKLPLEDSLVIALPSTCQKKQRERGTFDNMVMEQLGKALQIHIANLEKTLEEGAPAVAKRAAAVQAAEKEFNAATEAKANAQGELSTAETKRREAFDLVESSKGAVADMKVKLSKLGKVHEDKVAVCTKFENWNLSCFHQLRDKSAAPKTIVVDEANSAPVTQAGA